MEARIRLGERIGRGGMAEVFAAQLIGPAGFAKDVAVKRLLPRFSSDAVFLERFLNEARLAARLSHPNIVQIFELGHDGRDHYIVMEAVRGKSLRAVLERLDRPDREHESIASETAVFIAQALCAGLAHAHEKFSVIHRDVSPHNVLLSFDGGVKLIDFGIARATRDARLTQVGQVLGKRRYMSPEQVRGEELDGRSDLFAVGILLFEMLAGVHPFATDEDPEDLDVTSRMVSGARKQLLDHVPALDPVVAAVVERALAVPREQRFDSARAMDAALAAAKSTAGARDIETLLARLFEADANLPWPVDEARSDGAEHTATGAVVPPKNEITIASDITDPDEIEAESDLVSTSNADLSSRRTTPGTSASATASASVDKQSRRTLLIAALGLGTGALAAAAIGVAWALRRDDALVTDAGSRGVGATDASTRVGGVTDAGTRVGGVTDAGTPVGGAQDAGTPLGATGRVDVDAGSRDVSDAGTADERTDAGTLVFEVGDVDEVRDGKRRPRKPKKVGRLTIDTRPWTSVRIDGKRVGVTPLALDVAVGKRRVLLENAASGVRREVDVVVSADEPAVLRLDLRK